MDSRKLFDRLQAYGADMYGINDRFMGDAVLYEECLNDLLEEHNIELLAQAFSERNYAQKAFEAAHALKGLSGNLGLTPFYTAVNTLVESLRVKDYSHIEEEYAQFRRELVRLRMFCTGESDASGGPEPQEPEQKTAVLREKVEKHKDKSVPTTIAALVLIVLLVGGLFANLVVSYRNNTAAESASHLIEINYQIKQNVENRIENDWKIAYSIANGLEYGIADGNEEDMWKSLREERDQWGVSNIIVYTEDGTGLDLDGASTANDDASDTMYRARTQGEYMAIVRSTITYTLPVKTQMHIRGEKIAAVSIIQDMESFLDNMGFSSFDGAAFFYLTQADGVVLSKLTHPEAPAVFNIVSLMAQHPIEPITDDVPPMDRILSDDGPVIGIETFPEGAKYVVSTPISTRHERMRLFYFVPEAILNASLNSFSRYVTLLSVVVITVFAAGAVVIFLFIYRTRKKQFDKALITREHMFDLLVRNTHTVFGLFATNRSEPEYFSSNAESVIGERFIVMEKTASGYRLLNDAGEETEALRQLNEEMRDWDGKSAFHSGYLPNTTAQMPSWYAVELYPVDEEYTEYVGIAQDVTKTYEREEAVRNALAMAEKSNTAKSHFLSNMSHDIRTPMNAIINMTNFAMENMRNTRRLGEYLRSIRESADHLLKLINEILDMSRIDSGQTVVESRPLDVKMELERVCEIIRPLYEAKQQVFLADFSGIQTQTVLGDQMKLTQVMINLLGNAVKFTPDKGAVRFTATETPTLSAELTSMCFTVEDTGIGISNENIARIFDPFMRVDDRRVSGIEGTGLGLSICKSYVEAMGGAITCDSEEGSGSVFSVLLSFKKAESLSNSESHINPWHEHETPFAGKRCLVCEDNRTNQVIARTILERLGFIVEMAADGQEGKSKFLLSRRGYYDVVYMDIQMPVLDGYQTTVAIRESPHPQAKQVPIIAMTANVFAEDVEKCRIVGMNGYLSKPIMTLELIEETYRLLNEEGEKRT